MTIADGGRWAALVSVSGKLGILAQCSLLMILMAPIGILFAIGRPLPKSPPRRL